MPYERRKEMANEVAERKELGIVGQIKQMLADDKVKNRFNEILGANAQQYMASIVNTVSASAELKKCDAASILSAAFVAASFDLPIDQNLGFAAIVPYNRNVKDDKGNWVKVMNAQFQMMYKGFIQLAIRSGEYEKMNCSEVYADELVSFNPITGECEFVTDFSNCTQRDDGDPKNIAGYYAWFRLRSGFSKELYMSKQAVQNHAKKYSQAYRYDLSKNKQSSKWSTDFDAMAKKTVIKLLLSKWGILSVKMQQAIIEDQKIYDAEGDGAYSDNQPEVIQAQDPFAAIEDKGEPEPLPSQQITQQKEAVPVQANNGNQTEAVEAEFADFEAQFAEDQLPFK